MNPKATKSTFGSIHLTLGLITIVVTVGFFLLAYLFVGPRLVEDRAQAILSVIRSHEEDITFNRTRSVRDELLKSGTIAEDQQFSHYFSEDQKFVAESLQQCRFTSSAICLGSEKSIFFIASPDHLPPKEFKFAVVLKSDLSKPPRQLLLWESVTALILGLAFWLLHRAIQKKERYLLSRLNTASEAFSRARDLFADTPSHRDEFDAFSKSAEELVALLQAYKAKFERKTRLEQLGLTLGQISHDLKAPLNEAENFLSSLPLLLDSTTRQQLEEATASLIERIRSGKSSLSLALQQTKQITVAREEFALAQVLKSVQIRAKENPKLRDLSLTYSASADYITLGDQLRFETALLNLLENTADEKRDACVRVRLEAGETGHARILFEDDGGGIPEEYLEKVFEPLVTFKSSGTGLGLSSTKEILAQHGGYIRALPNTGGVKFEIQIPAMRGAHA